MKPLFSLTAVSVALSALVATNAAAFDRQTTHALKACHDHIWNLEEFKELPNAAVSVYPGSVDNGIHTVNWNVNWDDPTVRAAGNCQYQGRELIGFEYYGKNT